MPPRARPLRHRWDLTVPEARRLQERLRGRVIVTDRLGPVRRVAGADVAYTRDGNHLIAAVVVLDAETLEVLETAWVRAPVRFPYVPGYLSFREIPALLRAFARLARPPDLVICDGHGRAHPRRFGLACHLGLALGIPSIGCAKSLLVGSHRAPGARAGSRVALRDDGEVIGEVVRTREGVKPVYVSTGHRVSIATARRWVLRLARGYRLPEPTRLADRLVNRLRREGAAKPPR